MKADEMNHLEWKKGQTSKRRFEKLQFFFWCAFWGQFVFLNIYIAKLVFGGQ